MDGHHSKFHRVLPNTQPLLHGGHKKVQVDGYIFFPPIFKGGEQL